MKARLWYESDPNRLVLEYLRVVRLERGFVLRQFADRRLYWLGQVHDIPAGVEACPMKFGIVYRDAFPAEPPTVWVLEPELNPSEWGHEWHRWLPGNVCYVRPRNWNVGTTADEIIQKVADWYFNYTARKAGLSPTMADYGRISLETSRD